MADHMFAGLPSGNQNIWEIQEILWIWTFENFIQKNKNPEPERIALYILCPTEAPIVILYAYVLVLCSYLSLHIYILSHNMHHEDTPNC